MDEVCHFQESLDLGVGLQLLLWGGTGNPAGVTVNASNEGVAKGPLSGTPIVVLQWHNETILVDELFYISSGQ